MEALALGGLVLHLNAIVEDRRDLLPAEGPLPQDATTREAKARYRQLALRLHAVKQQAQKSLVF